MPILADNVCVELISPSCRLPNFHSAYSMVFVSIVDDTTVDIPSGTLVSAYNTIASGTFPNPTKKNMTSTVIPNTFAPINTDLESNLLANAGAIIKPTTIPGRNSRLKIGIRLSEPMQSLT